MVRIATPASAEMDMLGTSDQIATMGYSRGCGAAANAASATIRAIGKVIARLLLRAIVRRDRAARRRVLPVSDPATP